MDNILIIIAGLMAIGIVVHAYNMGWDAGHSVHHSDETHRPDHTPPPEVPTLWK